MMHISDKLTKVSDNFNIYMYDNGYMLEIGGRNANDDWSNAKIMCNSIEELTMLIEEAAGMTRD